MSVEPDLSLREWEDVRRVLCVRLDALGDVLMSTPAIRALRQSAPGRHVTLLTSASGAGGARLVPEIDAVITYEAPWMKATPPRRDAEAERQITGRLGAERFDAAVIFTVYSQNPLPAALLCHMAGIPRRLAHCHENPYQLLTTWVPDPEPALLVRHEVRRQLDLVAAVGCRAADERLSLRVPPDAMAAARQTLRAAGIDPDGRFAVIHPGATAPSRRYPPEGFARAARALVVLHRCPVVFTGVAGEADLVETIRSAMDAPSRSLAGRLSLEQLAGVIAAAPVLISNNSGPVHIAAALGVPVVDLYALTNPQHTPWMVPSRVLFHDVPCRYCFKSICPEGHHQCLAGVPPDAIVEAACDLLERRQGGRHADRAPALPPLAGRSRPDLGSRPGAGGGVS